MPLYALVKRLTGALAEETRRREGVEQQAKEIGKSRTGLETELAESKEARAKLSQTIASSTKRDI